MVVVRKQYVGDQSGHTKRRNNNQFIVWYALLNIITDQDEVQVLLLNHQKLKKLLKIGPSKTKKRTNSEFQIVAR